MHYFIAERDSENSVQTLFLLGENGYGLFQPISTIMNF